MKIVVILGSTRPKYRLGERVAKWVMQEIVKFPQAEFTLLDLRDYNLPFFNEEESPKGNKNRHPEEHVEKWLKDIESADGYIFIMPEYNVFVNAALKNAIDFIAHEAARKPAALIGYSDGANGGMYAPFLFRLILNELEIIAIPGEHIIFNTDKAISEEGNASKDQKEAMERRFSRLLNNLLWYTKALKEAK
jgi:NAD(P)H-dependent FMN reductase